MPLYDYKCEKCGTVREIRHGFDETVNYPCPDCGGEYKRMFHAAPIVFKGSGYYVTDSRASSPASKPDVASSESKPAESKPAETKPKAGDAKSEAAA